MGDKSGGSSPTQHNYSITSKYEGEKESEQAVAYVREACESLTGNFTPSDVSKWIKENKRVEIRPEGIGLYLRRIDYTTENKSVNGK